MRIFIFIETLQSEPFIIDSTMIESDQVISQVKRKFYRSTSSDYLIKGDYYLILSREEIIQSNFIPVNFKINEVINISLEEVLSIMWNEQINTFSIFNSYNQRGMKILGNENKKYFIWNEALVAKPHFSRLIDFILRFDVKRLSENYSINFNSIIGCLSLILNGFEMSTVITPNDVSRLLTVLYLIENTPEFDERRMLTGKSIDKFYQLFINLSLTGVHYPNFLIRCWKILFYEKKFIKYNINSIEEIFRFRISILLGDRLYETINWDQTILTPKVVFHILDSIIHNINININFVELSCRDVVCIPSFLYEHLIERTDSHMIFKYNGLKLFFFINSNYKHTIMMFSFSNFRCYFSNHKLYVSPLVLYSIIYGVVLIYSSPFVIQVEEFKEILNSGYVVITNENEKNKIMNEIEIINIQQ
jgi:hypothetical protein